MHVKYYSLRRKFVLLGCFMGLFNLVSHGQVNYPNRFNPEQGIVKDAEKPFRQEVCLNGRWEIEPVYSKDTSKIEIPGNFNWDQHKIKIPSPWNVNGFTGGGNTDFIAYPSYPKKWEDAMQAWLKKDFVVPASWKGDRVSLHFEAVAGKAIYYLNGKKIGENFDIFFPYELDITDKIKPGQENELLVLVMAPKLFDHQEKYGRRPYVSGSFWGTYICGIWQDVYLLSRPKSNLSHVFVLPEVNKKSLIVNVDLHNQTDKAQKVELSGEVHRWRNELDKNKMSKEMTALAPEQGSAFDQKTELSMALETPIVLNPGETKTVQISAGVKAGQLALWSPENPALHVLLLNMTVNGKKVDRQYQRFGWRQFLFNKDTLLLNGQPIRLKGDSWHFMGVPQMTRRYAWSWFTMLKKANANAVRLHAEPFPAFYLDVADEMGICVLDESAIWASDGGPDFGSPTYWANCITHIGHLVERDRNHASVFGWSICNETIPVARNVFHAPENIVDGLVYQINAWIKEVRKLDPTRPWISGDGETDVPTDLPTVVGHYGDKSSMEKWATEGRPWGIGEQSMAYYGTPKQVAAINGSRAYASQQGRMEGLATEAYRLLRIQQSLNATYSSVFNIVWYGLKPLNLGMKDTTRPTDVKDGIFFTHFKEGEPGMQPERLGPYTTTLNPGYDPSLPLYEPWPFFYAIKDANGLGKEGNSDGATIKEMDSKWERSPVDAKKKAELKKIIQNRHPNLNRKVYYLSDTLLPLFSTIRNLGVKIEHVTGLPVSVGADAIILMDGDHPPQGEERLAFIRRSVEKGANALILGVDAGSLNDLNKILPEPVELTWRQVSSLIVKSNDPILMGLDNSDFYFSEISKEPIMRSGLSGDFVRSGKVLLSACQTDWREWNGRAEYNKTSNVLKSERLAKPAGDILVKLTKGAGNIYLFGCQVGEANGTLGDVIDRMLRNLGAAFGAKGMAGNLPLTSEGRVQAALYCGRYSTSRNKIEDLINKDFMSPAVLRNPGIGQKVGDHLWRTGFVAEKNGEFDFKQLAAIGPEDNAASYLSFWLYSPRSLSNLLAEPDMPSVELEIETRDGLTVDLNAERIAQRTVTRSVPFKITNLQLKKGWNHILLKLIHFDGPWKTRIKFNSDHPLFLKQLHTSLENK